MGAIGIFADWSGGARFAEQIDMHGDEGEDSGGNDQYVSHEEARESDCAHICAPAHETLQPRTYEGTSPAMLVPTAVAKYTF